MFDINGIRVITLPIIATTNSVYPIITLARYSGRNSVFGFVQFGVTELFSLILIFCASELTKLTVACNVHHLVINFHIWRKKELFKRFYEPFSPRNQPTLPRLKLCLCSLCVLPLRKNPTNSALIIETLFMFHVLFLSFIC